MILFGLLAGVLSPALAHETRHEIHAFCVEDADVADRTEHCAACDHHEDSTTDPCPCSEHHHHQTCSHTAPLAVEVDKFVKLSALPISLADLEWSTVVMPDSPVFELDMPPLI